MTTVAGRLVSLELPEDDAALITGEVEEGMMDEKVLVAATPRTVAMGVDPEVWVCRGTKAERVELEEAEKVA